MQLYALSTQPWYDSINKIYRKVITISQKPTGPLSKMAFQKQMPPLSSFQVSTHCNCNCKCGYIIYDLETNEPLCPDKITSLYEFLMQNGYEIDYKLSKLTPKNPQLLCYIKYP